MNNNTLHIPLQITDRLWKQDIALGLELAIGDFNRITRNKELLEQLKSADSIEFHIQRVSEDIVPSELSTM